MCAMSLIYLFLFPFENQRVQKEPRGSLACSYSRTSHVPSLLVHCLGNRTAKSLLLVLQASVHSKNQQRTIHSFNHSFILLFLVWISVAAPRYYLRKWDARRQLHGTSTSSKADFPWLFKERRFLLFPRSESNQMPGFSKLFLTWHLFLIAKVAIIHCQWKLLCQVEKIRENLLNFNWPV